MWVDVHRQTSKLNVNRQNTVWKWESKQWSRIEPRRVLTKLTLQKTGKRLVISVNDIGSIDICVSVGGAGGQGEM